MSVSFEKKGFFVICFVFSFLYAHISQACAESNEGYATTRIFYGDEKVSSKDKLAILLLSLVKCTSLQRGARQQAAGATLPLERRGRRRFPLQLPSADLPFQRSSHEIQGDDPQTVILLCCVINPELIRKLRRISMTCRKVLKMR